MHRTHAGHGSIWPAEAVEAHASLDAAERASRAREDALREAAALLDLTNGDILLAAGEMPASELLTARAVLAWRRSAILALINKPKGGDVNAAVESRYGDATSPGVTAGASAGEDGELCKRVDDTLQAMASQAFVPMGLWDKHSNGVLALIARIRSLSSRVERAEQLAYTGAISLASIDEGATRPETWKERAENRQAVFLLAKRRAEAAESEAAALREALRPFVSHYEPWMERQADGDRMCVYPVHTMGDLRRARTALEGRDNG